MNSAPKKKKKNQKRNKLTNVGPIENILICCKNIYRENLKMWL